MRPIPARWRGKETFSREYLLKRKEGPYVEKIADIHSIGMVVWQIHTRKKPFEHIISEDKVSAHIDHGGKEQIPSDCPKILAILIQDCWESPDKRPTAAMLKQRVIKYKAELETEALEKNRPTSTSNLDNEVLKVKKEGSGTFHANHLSSNDFSGEKIRQMPTNTGVIPGSGLAFGLLSSKNGSSERKVFSNVRMPGQTSLNFF